jgi:hypothetical protein
MPYIKADDGRRNSLKIGDVAKNAGELNYQMFYYIKHNYCEQLSVNGSVGKKIIEDNIKLIVDNFLVFEGKTNYQRWNDMTGAMIRCYKEIKRRLGIDVKDLFIEIMESYDHTVDVYEDEKIISNGDVE